ncbi:MAG: hypothetical protein CMF72_22790 [Mameliella sp.]|nr:hypothetical protein [Mameliella sp.]|tara:strand:- start:458 stop:823 length:366 start_codon:yes stop_codon:yes gene_type:complete
MLDRSIPVTAHAVLRYMTRIMRLRLDGLEKRHGRTSNLQVLTEAAALHRLDLPTLQRTICPPHLEPAGRGGACRISTGAYSLICDGGVVVTIVERRQRPTKARTEGELRRERGRRNRRWNA